MRMKIHGRMACPLLLTTAMLSSPHRIWSFPLTLQPSTRRRASTTIAERKRHRRCRLFSTAFSATPVSATTTTGRSSRHPEFPEWAYEDRDFFRFELIHQSSKSQARVGRIHTPHGIVDTPGYVAVATNAALKGVDFRQASEAGQQLIFANTYHLLIHPGSSIIKDAGGIHSWTNRKDRPFITDSGGFQVFSLAYGSVHEELTSQGELKRRNKKRTAGQHSDMVQVSEDGAIFRSYRDGCTFLLSPESTVQAQKDIGADIIIPLDELPPYHVEYQRLIESVDR